MRLFAGVYRYIKKIKFEDMTRKQEIIMQAKATAKVNRLAYPMYAIEEGFVSGAEWADETMMKRAIEWLQEHSGDYLLYPFCEFDKGSLIEDFKKYMEEI